jgi:NAD dependent epimerase/dehydratase
MKILVTGSSGFIGSHLVQTCLMQGHQVRAFVRYNSMSSAGWLDTLDNRSEIEVVFGDIRDYDSVRSAMIGVDGVFHLAALIGIPYSYVSPLAYIRTNIDGTYNVLQAAKDLDTQNVIVTSTSETYGSAQYAPIDERHPMLGQSPYSASKISADNLAVSYYRSFNIPVKIARPFNVFGPRQSARAIIPSIIIQILSGKREVLIGNPSPTRDFTFVSDTVSGLLKIFHEPSFSGEYVNIGNKNEISIGDLVNLIARLMKVEVRIVTDKERLRPLKSEVDRLLCDSNKLRRATNWNPVYSLSEGLLETIRWINVNQALYRDIYNV